MYTMLLAALPHIFMLCRYCGNRRVLVCSLPSLPPSEKLHGARNGLDLKRLGPPFVNSGDQGLRFEPPLAQVRRLFRYIHRKGGTFFNRLASSGSRWVQQGASRGPFVNSVSQGLRFEPPLAQLRRPFRYIHRKGGTLSR